MCADLLIGFCTYTHPYHNVYICVHTQLGRAIVRTAAYAAPFPADTWPSRTGCGALFTDLHGDENSPRVKRINQDHNFLMELNQAEHRSFSSALFMGSFFTPASAAKGSPSDRPQLQALRPCIQCMASHFRRRADK